MKLPNILITLPAQQMDSVTQFCHAWDGPIIVEHDDKQVVMMPYDYYKENFCAQVDVVEIERKLHRCVD
ncbi:MAG: hypothetical protein RR063_10100 [Anaerovoracaceae bacterium]